MTRNMKTAEEKGRAIAERLHMVPRVAEIAQIHDMAGGDSWEEIVAAYYAGMAAGYEGRKKEERKAAKR